MTKNSKLSAEELEEVLESIEPYINYCLLQTSPENRSDLKQHLYYKSLHYLNNIELRLNIELFH